MVVKKSATKYVKGLIILLLLVDLGYTFIQNYNQNIDGDVPAIVVPSNHYQKVLHDPFGISVIKDNEKYAATNRFFAHASMIIYFKNIHGTIQLFFTDKINAIYFSVGLLNTIAHLILLLLITSLITGHFRFYEMEALITLVIICPFFQQHGYNNSIGLIDNSVTYTFFYALPLSVLILYFRPLFLQKLEEERQHKMKWYHIVFLLMATLYLPFSGAIILPIILIFLPVVISIDYLFIRSIKFSLVAPTYKVFVIILYLLSIYSFFIGRNNIEGSHHVDLATRYEYLWQGIPSFFGHSNAFVWLGGLLILHAALLISKGRLQLESNSFKWLLVVFACAILYIMILPLGGYRPYRPWIIRYDLFIPCAMIIIYLIGSSGKQIIKLAGNNVSMLMLLPLLITMIHFTLKDEARISKNDCQKNALYQLQASDQEIVKLTKACNVLRWEKIKHPKIRK